VFAVNAIDVMLTHGRADNSSLFLSYPIFFIFLRFLGWFVHAAVWLQAKVRERGLGLRPRLNAGPLCAAQRHWGGLRRSKSRPCLFHLLTNLLFRRHYMSCRNYSRSCRRSRWFTFWRQRYGDTLDTSIL